MSTEAPTRPRRRSIGSYVALAALFVAGIVGGLLLLALSVWVEFEHPEGMSERGMFLLFSSFVLVPVTALLLTRNRYWRGLAAGLSASWIAIGLLWWQSPGPGMTDDEIDRETARILASGRPAYYLGDEADGHALDWIQRDGEQGATGVYVEYGLSCGGYDSGCSTEVDVATLSLSREWIIAYGGCSRIEPVLGVPAATSSESLLLFTAESLVSIDIDEAARDQEGARALASQLRPLGGSTAVTSLPPPTARTLAFATTACGPAPEPR